MSDKQAIEVLEDLRSRTVEGSWTYDALTIAIEAIKKRKRA